jgi:GLPGLI family protein
MKQLTLALITFCSFNCAFAQHTTGKVVYNETVKLTLALEDLKIEGAEQFADMIPKEQSFKKELYFTDAASLYRAVAKDPKEENYQQGNGRQIKINMDVPQDVVYRDLKEKKLIQQKDFMSRKFLVTSDQEKFDWKMTGKQKLILGYPCQEATTMGDDSQKIVAWFTPAIPVSTGPSETGGLPGLILSLAIGKIYSIEAASVDFNEFDKKILAKPTQGKKMTRKQFEAIMTEKRKEMQEQFGGSGNVIIKVQNK